MNRPMNKGKVRKLWQRLRAQLNFGVIMLGLHPKSVLVLEGWNRSFRTRQAVNRAGEPIPWCSYAFIHFIESRLTDKLRIFEYGCGSSTLFYTRRVREVIAVEHNLEWGQRISEQLPRNGQVVIQQQETEYTQEVLRHGLFDIVIIDGIYRLQTVPYVLQALNPTGIAIWDNSDRPEFANGYSVLKQAGFRELSFYGLGPTSFMPFRTSVLYRDDNCLGI